MTDARYPERWLNDRRITRLCGDAHKLFTTSMAWSVSNRTDGLIGDDDLLDLLHVDLSHVTTLERAGLWKRVKDGWLIVDFASTQTSADQLVVLENARRRDREKKARQRATARESPDDSTPRDVPGDAAPRTSEARQGQDRPRQEVPRANVKRCELCNEPLTPAAVAAGWSKHGTCDWPDVTDVPA